MRRLSLFLFIFLSFSIIGDEFEYAKFTIGPDKFNSSTGVFQRLNCDENAPETKIYLSLEPAQLDIILKLARLDINEGNADTPDDFSKLCVSSFPYEVSLHKSAQVLVTTCLSPIDEYKSELAKFVYDLEEIKKLEASKCTFY